ncbi:MAG: peptide deformylase [Candidatus Omnitrophica bacterium]|nr:peptide deformylase [Candidatus Omnitrophota bacterium]
MLNNMVALEIKQYPEAVLRKECAEVKHIAEKEKKFFDEMLFTMKHFHGIGLAAPQVGISKRLIVVEVKERIIKLANPKIMDSSGLDSMKEGCLSVPNVMVNIKRPYKIVVKGLDEHGRVIHIKTEGLLARVLQHEIDHLKGRTIVNSMSVLEKLKFKLNNFKI